MKVDLLTGFLNCGFALLLDRLFISSTLTWRAVLNSSLHSWLRGLVPVEEEGAALVEEERPACVHMYILCV